MLERGTFSRSRCKKPDSTNHHKEPKIWFKDVFFKVVQSKSSKECLKINEDRRLQRRSPHFLFFLSLPYILPGTFYSSPLAESHEPFSLYIDVVLFYRPDKTFTVEWHWGLNNMISVVSATWRDWTSRVYSWYPWPNWYNSLAWLWCLFVHVHQQRRDHRIPFLVKISNFTFQNPLMCKSSGNLGSKFIWNCMNFNMIPFPF